MFHTFGDAALHFVPVFALFQYLKTRRDLGARSEGGGRNRTETPRRSNTCAVQSYKRDGLPARCSRLLFLLIAVALRARVASSTASKYCSAGVSCRRLMRYLIPYETGSGLAAPSLAPSSLRDQCGRSDLSAGLKSPPCAAPGIT